MHLYKLCPLLLILIHPFHIPQVIKCFSCLKTGGYFLQTFLPVVFLKLLQHLDLILQFPVFNGKVS